MSNLIFNRILLLIGVILTMALPNIAQDVHFSQYYNFPLTVNPAMTGDLKGSMRFVTNYRSQWKSVAVPFSTFSSSFEFAALQSSNKKRYLGIGLLFLSDKAGDFQLATNQLNFSISSNIILNRKNSISAGLLTGIGQKSYDPAKLRWGNQFNGQNYDPTIYNGEPFYFNRIFYKDFGSGIVWKYDGNMGQGGTYNVGMRQPKASLGIALDHINRPNISFFTPRTEKLAPKLVVHGDYVITGKYSNLSLLPSFIYEKQGTLHEILIGGMIRYLLKEGTLYTGFTDGQAISFGVFYRKNDAVIISTLIEHHQYSFGISYDVNVSALMIATSGRGGVEFSLRYIAPEPRWFNANGKRRIRAKF